jgi:hypothetical protein
MVRVGAVHYDTLEEIEWFGEALGRIEACESYHRHAFIPNFGIILVG